MDDKEYLESIAQWRSDREKSIADPYGWLSAAGLFWLMPGENHMGSASSNPILIPGESSHTLVGSFVVEGEQVRLISAPGVEIYMEGSLITDTEITFQDDSSTDINYNGIKLYLIRRGNRIGVRIFDPQNARRLAFDGLNWFPINRDYHVHGCFTPLQEPTPIDIINVLGDHLQLTSPGWIDFTVTGQVSRLTPVLLEDGRLWLMFRDETNSLLTYPAGRYLIADAPRESQVLLDFNKAYNPPCAYTDFATCPLPIADNWLRFPINAGEKLYL